MAFELSSPAFSEGSTIPKRYTCDGADSSPELVWKEPPTGTQSFALICDDPDAPVGTWVHWVVYNIPAVSHKLVDGLAAIDTLPDGTKQGINDFTRIGYGGPCPPRGTPHRYFFKLYALDTSLTLSPDATKATLEKAMKGHILAETKLMGRYGR